MLSICTYFPISSLCYHNPIELTTCYSNITPASYFEFDAWECKEDITP